MFYNVVLVSAIQRSGPAIHILPCVCTHAQSLSHVQLSATPWTAALQAPLSIDFPGKNTGVGCHFLLQGIFLIQGSNPYLLHLLHWQVDSLPLGSPSGKLRKGKEIFLCLPLFSCLQLKRIFRPKWHILGWHILPPFIHNGTL